MSLEIIMNSIFRKVNTFRVSWQALTMFAAWQLARIDEKIKKE